jgi:hypothetical protein
MVWFSGRMGANLSDSNAPADSAGRRLRRSIDGADGALSLLLALNRRPRHGQARQVLGEDRSRQPMTGAAVHDPSRRLATRLRCNAARGACSYPDYKCSVSYSITLSAVARSVCGMAIPSALAVLRLTTKSNSLKVTSTLWVPLF